MDSWRWAIPSIIYDTGSWVVDGCSYNVKLYRLDFISWNSFCKSSHMHVYIAIYIYKFSSKISQDARLTVPSNLHLYS